MVSISEKTSVIVAELDEIVFKADDQFALIRDRSSGGGTVVLTHEESVFVRDQITAALAAGLVRP